MGILQLILLLTIPGLFAYSYLKEETRESLSLSGKYAFVIGISVAITTILAVLMVTVYRFWLDILIAFYVVLLPISCRRLWKQDLLKKPAISWKRILPLAFALLMLCFLYFQPTQYYIGGRDPGVYVNTALHISNTGNIQKHDPLIEEVNEKYPGVFQDQHLKYPGFYLDIIQGQTYINPQFYHGYTLWLSIAHTLLGMDRFLFITPLFGLLTLLILYATIKDLFGTKVAAASTVLISINIAQIWYARSPYTEILSQLLLWLSIFLLYNAHKKEEQMLSFLGGFAITAAILVRIDNIFTLIPLIAYFAIVYIRDNSSFKKWWGYYLPSLMAGGILYLAYARKYSREYTSYQLIRDNSLVPDFLSLTQLFLILGALGLIGIFIIWLLRKPLNSLLITIEKHRKPLLNILGLVVTLSFLYLYFIRPNIVDPYSHLHVNMPSMRAATLVRLGWYISFVGIWVSLGGFIYMLRKDLGREYLFFFLTVFFNFVLFLYDPKIHADHFWAVRRHVPFIIPTLIIFMAVAMDRIYKLGTKLKTAKGAAALLMLYFIGFSFYCSYPFLKHTEYGGVREDLEKIASRFGENDIIITPDTNFAARLVGNPLDLIYDKTVLPLRNNYNVDRLNGFIKEQKKKGKSVYLLLSAGDSNMENPELYYEYMEQFPVLSHTAESSYDHRPNRVIPRQWKFNLYRCVQKSEWLASSFMDIGSPDDVNVTMRGFYGAESDGENTYRWGDGNAQIEIPFNLEDETITRANGLNIRARHFLADQGPQEVKVYINGSYADSIFLTTEFTENPIEFSSDSLKDSDRLNITFETATDSPKDRGMGADERQLGMMLDWIALSQR